MSDSQKDKSQPQSKQELGKAFGEFASKFHRNMFMVFVGSVLAMVVVIGGMRYWIVTASAERQALNTHEATKALVSTLRDLNAARTWSAAEEKILAYEDRRNEILDQALNNIDDQISLWLSIVCAICTILPIIYTYVSVKDFQNLERHFTERINGIETQQTATIEANRKIAEDNIKTAREAMTGEITRFKEDLAQRVGSMYRAIHQIEKDYKANMESLEESVKQKTKEAIDKVDAEEKRLNWTRIVLEQRSNEIERLQQIIRATHTMMAIEGAANYVNRDRTVRDDAPNILRFIHDIEQFYDNYIIRSADAYSVNSLSERLIILYQLRTLLNVYQPFLKTPSEIEHLNFMTQHIYYLCDLAASASTPADLARLILELDSYIPQLLSRLHSALALSFNKEADEEDEEKESKD